MSATMIASARFSIFFTLATMSRSFGLIPMSGSFAAWALKFGGKTSMMVVKTPLSTFWLSLNHSITFCR